MIGVVVRREKLNEYNLNGLKTTKLELAIYQELYHLDKTCIVAFKPR